jgi:diguanylate cyclase (GGDEF)-like protein/PAS domain S-box-containing protein
VVERNNPGPARPGERQEVERSGPPDAGDLTRSAAVFERSNPVGRVGVWQWEPDSNVSHWNQVMREIVGVGEDIEPDPKLWLDIVHPDDREIAREAISTRALEGETRHRIVTPEGQVRHVLIRSEKIESESGPDRYMGLVIDVTESQEATSLVVDTLESISDSYFAIDTDWTITYANRQSETLLGRSRHELVGRNFWEEYPEAADSPFAQYRKAMEERVPVEIEDFYDPLDMWLEARVYPTRHGIAIYFRDVSERHEAEAARERMLRAERTARAAAESAKAVAEYQASHDSLTDLLNRTELMRRLGEVCKGQTAVTMLFLDVDRFKMVNDSLGHAMGDRLLQEVGRRLEKFSDEVDLVARFGGDEFVVGLYDCDQACASSLAERILEELRRPITINGRLLHVTVSVGVAQSSPGMSAEELLLNADVTLYRAKETGRDRMTWFDETLRTKLMRRVGLERRLRQAIDDDGLTMEFQPTYDLATGRLTDIEALARWTDPDYGKVSPAEFIPIAEDSGLIHALGTWAARHVAAEAFAWGEAGNDPATFWVNVSTNQLVRPDVGVTIKEQLDRCGLDPGRFGIEITESALADRTNLVEGLRRVADTGIKIAIDDFGTGFSSISRLRDLPVDILKVDRSFIAGIREHDGVETLAAIVDLAHSMGAVVIAEGIETPEEHQAVSLTGCDRVSGYLFGHPVPLDDLPGEIRSGQGRFTPAR